MCNTWDHPMVLQGLHHEEATALTNLNAQLLLLLQTRRPHCSLLHPLHHPPCSCRPSHRPPSQPLFHTQCILHLSLSARAQQTCLQSRTHDTEQFTTSQRLTTAYSDSTYLHWSLSRLHCLIVLYMFFGGVLSMGSFKTVECFIHGKHFGVGSSVRLTRTG